MYKEIILPLDGSALAETAIPHALDAAKCHGARLTVLTVLEPFHIYPCQVDPYSGLWGSAELEQAEKEEWETEGEQRKAYVDKVVEKVLRGASVPVLLVRAYQQD